MRKIVYIFIFFSILTSISYSGENIAIVRILFENIEQMTQVNSRLTPLNEQEGLLGYYRVNSDDIMFIKSLGLKYELQSEKEPTFPVITELDSAYYTQQAMIDSLFSWAEHNPQIAMVESIGVSQQEHRVMYAMKISDSVSVDDDEPVVLFDGAHHACEVMGMEICMALADSLISGYGRVDSINQIVDNTQIWIVPLINPDGNSAVHAGISYYYRKNGRDLDGDGDLYEYQCNNWWTCSTEGVDLNRNYDWYWNYGGSNIPMNYYYHGEAAGSESENQAITGLIARIRPVTSLTYHSYGEVVYYPWQWVDGSSAPDNSVIQDIVGNFANRIMKEDGYSYYDPTPSDGRSGQSINYQYGRYGVLDFSPETVAYPDFIPDRERKNAVIENNLNGVFYLLQRANGSQIKGTVTDGATGLPVESEIRIRGMYSGLVNPRTSDPITGRYRRLVNPGVYSIDVITPNYGHLSYEGVIVAEGIPTVLNIRVGDLIWGDVNSSGGVNGLDVIYLVNYLKSRGPAPIPLQIGDVNGDCNVNSLDVTYLVNYYKSNGPGPVPGNCP